jgi:Ca2+/Na+ antiporter
MWRAFNEMPRCGTAGLLLVFFLFLFVLFFRKIAILAGLTLFLFFLVVVIQIFGNDVQVNGMGLRHFELGFTFRAAQNLALFHLIFVDINLCGTLRAANHGSILRTVFKRVDAAWTASTTVERII